jgi:hypothetical protein
VGAVSTADRQVIQVSEPVYRRLTDLKVRRQEELKRLVSYTEVIELLLEVRIAEMYRGAP